MKSSVEQTATKWTFVSSSKPKNVHALFKTEMLLYLLYWQAFQDPFIDTVLNLPVSNKPRKPKKMQKNHNFNPMVYFVHIVFFFYWTALVKNETSTTELLPSVPLNFSPPRRQLSVGNKWVRLSQRVSSGDRNCCGIHAGTFTFRLVYIQGVQHEFTKVTKSCQSLRWWQVRSSHWGTAEWQYSYSTTVAQRNTSRGKSHNIHFRVCFAFSFCFVFLFFLKTKNFGSGENLKMTRRSITLQVHQTLFFYLSIKWGNQTCVMKCRQFVVQRDTIAAGTM